MSFTGGKPSPGEFLTPQLWRSMRDGCWGAPPARGELQRRLERSPVEVARQLAKVYGHELKSVEYIAAMALVARLRLGELTKDATHRPDVEPLAPPYITANNPLPHPPPPPPPA